MPWLHPFTQLLGLPRPVVIIVVVFVVVDADDDEMFHPSRLELRRR